ncbi:hypothetical protein AU476_39345 [Cupriavidus sp. UYMSc13B]|nr:hypothetical protein AU476_39345 [Cupriavidus sp. UYMSc13B]
MSAAVHSSEGGGDRAKQRKVPVSAGQALKYKELAPQVAQLAPIMRRGSLVWQGAGPNLQPSFGTSAGRRLSRCDIFLGASYE